jgi:hypothetical protein
MFSEQRVLLALFGDLAAPGCRPIFNCTITRPRDIGITRAIGELKMTSLTGRLE